ncbi:hypothetical protein I3843_08G035400 [Carya illinoinensis]|nr:hypothetical protein I3843_08G035400 [Carya illinoinensis]
MTGAGDLGIPGAQIAVVVVSLVVLAKIVFFVVVCNRRPQGSSSTVSLDSRFLNFTMDKFHNDREREKPVQFTSQQLRIATENFTNFLGSGAFGSVYKGIFSDGTMVAVKVLHGNSDKRTVEQFMAEVRTVGIVHHSNLVHLHGFCFEKHLRALILGFEKLHEIAVGTARGIAYLHEECQQRIIRYNIKPGNILLDANFLPKVTDFGLAKLCHSETTHITMTGGRGTPDYEAPEMWMPYPITHKCDIYSFGMLLFEITGRRRNLEICLPESQEWSPERVWKKFEHRELGELTIVCGIEEKYRETAERMVKVAFWCLQYGSNSRPLMSAVVKMLERAIEIPKPINPFQHMFPCPAAPSHPLQTSSSFDSEFSSQMVTISSKACTTPVMRKYEIEIASM